MTICPTRPATCAGGLNAPYTRAPAGWKCRNANRVSTPQRNGTTAPAQRAAVRAGSVTGVTPTTGSLSRMDRVSRYVAIMPNPPRKIHEYQFPVPTPVAGAFRSSHVVHAVIATANRKTGLRTNRRVSRAASAVKVARLGEVAGVLGETIVNISSCFASLRRLGILHTGELSAVVVIDGDPAT